MKQISHGWEKDPLAFVPDVLRQTKTYASVGVYACVGKGEKVLR